MLTSFATGATQVKSMAKVLSKLDTQNGFLDRFIISVPRPFRPTPEDQVNAKTRLNQFFNFGIEDLYTKLNEVIDVANPTEFYLSEDASK